MEYLSYSWKARLNALFIYHRNSALNLKQSRMNMAHSLLLAEFEALLRSQNQWEEMMNPWP